MKCTYGHSRFLTFIYEKLFCSNSSLLIFIMPLEYIKSQRGKDKLVHDGCLHTIHMKKDNGIVWRCTNFKRVKGLCPRKISTFGEDIVEVSGSHNHAANLSGVKLATILASIRHRAENSQDNARTIIAQHLIAASNQVRSTISIPNISRNIRRRRQRRNAIPVLPQNTIDLQIPHDYQHLTDGTQFLIFDSGPGQNRTLIFSTNDDLQSLLQFPNWAADGTFSVVPNVFEQLYTIHIKLGFQYIPVIYILMTQRTEDAYAAAFQEILNICPNLAPTKIYTDYELAAINAFSRIFQGVIMKGCYFHHTQAVWRKIQEHGLAARYGADEEFALQLRMIPAIAFVPTDRVSEYFDLLAVALPDEAEPILSYYEDTYIGRMRGNRRREPRFPTNHWNVYVESLGEEPKTTNSLEGWHRAFSGALGSVHPNIWKFITFLRTEQALNATKRAGFVAGNENRPNKKYAAIASRIKVLVQRFAMTEPLAYLRSLAHNFNF